MRKLLCTASVLAAFTIPAQAEEIKDLNPYAGFDLQRTSYDYNSNYGIDGGLALDGAALLEDSLNGANVHFGVRPYKNFGAEVGYFRTKEEGKSIASGSTVGPGTIATADFTTDVRVQGVTLDALGYLPLGPQERLELIGTVGLSWSKAEVELNVPGAGNGSTDESEIGIRAGGGAQFNFTDHMNIRGLARYQTADFDSVADNAMTYSLGLNYRF